MQLLLTEKDFERMPPALRQGLLAYLAGAPQPEAAGSEATPLGRAQVTALLRDVSFHRDGKALHALLKRLAYGEESEAPPRRRLTEALPKATPRLFARYLATLNRLAARAAGAPGTRLWRLRRGAGGAYAVHPATRQALRELLPTLARSGIAEEPLWEGR